MTRGKFCLCQISAANGTFDVNPMTHSPKFWLLSHSDKFFFLETPKGMSKKVDTPKGALELC